MLQALTLALLLLTDTVKVWHIIFLGIFLGFVDAFDIPTRQSFVVDMVENKEDLGNAIALNSSMVNVARLVGPSVAGILIASVGEGMCFLLNAISYIAVILSLLAMKIKPMKMKTEQDAHFSGVERGFFLCVSFHAYQIDLAADCTGQLNRNALYCAYADFCQGIFFMGIRIPSAFSWEPQASVL